MNHIEEYPTVLNRQECEYYIQLLKNHPDKQNWTGFYEGVSIIDTVPIDQYFNQYCTKHPSLFTKTLHQFPAFNIQHYQPNEYYSIPHVENGPEFPERILVWMVYLNTLTDGGGTQFPEQNMITQPIQGNLIIWPATFPYVHCGVNSPTQHKFILTGWYSLTDT